MMLIRGNQRPNEITAPPARPEDDRRAWIASALISVAVHFILIVFLFFGFSSRRADVPKPPVMIIQILAPPTAPPTPAREIAPGVKRNLTDQMRPAPTLTSEHTLPPVPVIRNGEPAVAIPNDRTVDHTSEPTSKTEEASAPPVPPVLPKAVLAAPAETQPSTFLTSADQNWEGLVLARIDRMKRYPSDAERAGQQDMVFVHIAIDRKGNILRESIERSEHIQVLENAALDAVRRAGPFPPPPPSEAGDTVEFVVPIEFYLSRNGQR